MDEIDRYRYQLAKGYLDWVKDQAEVVESIKEARDKKRELMDGLRGHGEGETVSGTKDPHRLEDAVIAADDLDKAFADEIKAHSIETTLAVRAIVNLKDGKHMKLLLDRYVSCKPWKVIERDMHFEHSWVMEMHRRAVVELYEFIPERWKTPKAVE